MHLTAHAMGIGAYWSSGGPTYSKGMKKFLGLGKKDKCLGLFYMGYPENPEKIRKSKRDPLKDFVEWRD